MIHIPYFCWQPELGHLEKMSTKNRITKEQAEAIAGRPLQFNKEGVAMDDCVIIHYDVDVHGEAMYFRLARLVDIDQKIANNVRNHVHMVGYKGHRK